MKVFQVWVQRSFDQNISNPSRNKIPKKTM